MIIVDSSVWISYFNGKINSHTDYLNDILGNEPVGIGDLILTEVLQGFRSDADFKSAKKWLGKLTVYPIIGTRRALQAAENVRTLRQFTVCKTADTLIATFCIDRNYSLLFCDKDFEPFVELLGLRAAMSIEK